MNRRFLVKRTLQVFVSALCVLTLVYVARGQPWVGALEDAALWSSLSTILFAGTMVYHQKTKKSCAACVETPPSRHA